MRNLVSKKGANARPHKDIINRGSSGGGGGAQLRSMLLEARNVLLQLVDRGVLVFSSARTYDVAADLAFRREPARRIRSCSRGRAAFRSRPRPLSFARSVYLYFAILRLAVGTLVNR